MSKANKKNHGGDRWLGMDGKMLLSRDTKD